MQRHGSAFGDRREHRGHGAALEGKTPGQELVEHHAESEQVALGVEFTIVDSFRWHVRRSAHERPVVRQRGGLAVDLAGEAEVDDPHAPRLAFEKHVGRLDVAVEDAAAMRGGEPRGDLLADPQDVAEWERAGDVAVVAERPPFEQLHDDVGHALMLAHLMDRHHMRVLDRSEGSALADEPLPGGRVAGVTGRHHLDRHSAVEAVVVGQVDAAHRSGTDQAEHPIVADRPGRRLVHHDAGISGHLEARFTHERGGQRRVCRLGVALIAADDERAEGIAAVHAARLLDDDPLLEVGRQTADDAGGEQAELPLRRIDKLQFVGGGTEGLEHRGRRPGFFHAHHPMDDRFGVFDQVERLPSWVDERAGHLHEMRRQKLSELPDDLGQGAAGRQGEFLEHRHRVGVGIDAGREVFLARHRRARH